MGVQVSPKASSEDKLMLRIRTTEDHAITQGRDAGRTLSVCVRPQHATAGKGEVRTPEVVCCKGGQKRRGREGT
jgi:hypothetical protein